MTHFKARISSDALQRQIQTSPGYKKTLQRQTKTSPIYLMPDSRDNTSQNTLSHIMDVTENISKDLDDVIQIMTQTSPKLSITHY